MAQEILLVPIGADRLQDELIRYIRDGLREALDVDVEIGDPIAAPLGPDDRVESAALVDQLIARSTGRGTRWYLGITAADLDAPERRWVFGEATQGGRWALVSVARFGATEHPGPRMLERALKEALHEIGHLAELDHCDDRECIMAMAGSVAAVDGKNSKFCPRCSARLGDLSRA